MGQRFLKHSILFCIILFPVVLLIILLISVFSYPQRGFATTFPLYHNYYVDHIDDNLGAAFLSLSGFEPYISSVISSIYIQEHAVARSDSPSYILQYRTLCRDYSLICDKIIFVGDFDDKDKYVYMSSVVYVISSLDSFLQEAGYPSLSNVLDSLHIYAEGGDRRGKAGWYTISLYPSQMKNYMEFVEVLTHELGHIIDLGLIQGVDVSKDTAFTEFGKVAFAADDFSLNYYGLSWESEKVRPDSTRSRDFCSGYGITNPFEDFAECLNLYLHHNALFRLMASDNILLQEKYNHIASLFAGNYLFANRHDLSVFSDYPLDRRPWDTTRMY